MAYLSQRTLDVVVDVTLKLLKKGYVTGANTCPTPFTMSHVFGRNHTTYIQRRPGPVGLAVCQSDDLMRPWSNTLLNQVLNRTYGGFPQASRLASQQFGANEMHMLVIPVLVASAFRGD